MEKDRDSEAEELNISREEIDKELTEEEARQLREERRLRREQIRTAPMDEPDEWSRRAKPLQRHQQRLQWTQWKPWTKHPWNRRSSLVFL